ncbi:hypothetical protein ACFQ4O_07115 [Methylopila musalis]|uniref:Uncharacterized protein n=1 Tax=Methylopila musalis TaxID=1134781 RepID=A0ABW3Z675_9HYPH
MRRIMIMLSLALSCAGAPARAETIALGSLGVRVEKPDDWHVISLEAYRANLARLAPGKLKDMAKQSSSPLIAFFKYTEPHPDINPSFKILMRSVSLPDHVTALDIATTVVAQMQVVLPGATFEQPLEWSTIGGRRAAHFRMAYPLEVGAATFPIVSEMWLVRRGPEVFMIGVTRRADETEAVKAEFARVVDSVRIDDGG